MTTVYFTRTNADGTIDQMVEFETDDSEFAEDYCDERNSNLSLAGIPSSVACFHTA